MNANELILCSTPTGTFSSEPVERGGRMLGPGDHAVRNASTELVERIRANGRLTYEYEDVLLVTDHRHFLFELPSRIASTGTPGPRIACVGTYEWGGSAKLFQFIIASIERYARATGRTVTQTDLSHIYGAFDRIGPVDVRQQLRVNHAGGLILLTLLVVFYITFTLLTL